MPRLLLLACLACSAPPATPADDTGAPDDVAPDAASCTMTPTIAWVSEPTREPLADGDEVVLVHGPQGGWHVGLQIGVVGPLRLSVSAAVEVVATGEQLGGDDNTYAMSLFEHDATSCAGEVRGMLAYLDDLPDFDQARICALDGQDLRLMVTVADRDTGAEDRVELAVVARADPTDPCD